jgi:hypothetical protein
MDIELTRLLRDLYINQPVVRHALLRYREQREGEGHSGNVACECIANIDALAKWSEENVIYKAVDNA